MFITVTTPMLSELGTSGAILLAYLMKAQKYGLSINQKAIFKNTSVQLQLQEKCYAKFLSVGIAYVNSNDKIALNIEKINEKYFNFQKD